MAFAMVIATLGALLTTVLGLAGLIERLPRNHIAGIRTPYTLQSDEHWRVTHREGAPLMIFGSVAAFAAGLAFTPFAIAGKLDEGLATAVVLAMAIVLVGGALASWRYGTSRAKKLVGD